MASSSRKIEFGGFLIIFHPLIEVVNCIYVDVFYYLYQK